MFAVLLSLVFLTVLFCIVVELEACIYPTGVSSDPGFPADGIFTSQVVPNGPIIEAKEVPIQFRLTLINNIAIWSAMAAFEPTALDHYGRLVESEARRRCSDDPFFDLQRKYTLAYVTYFAVLQQIPEVTDLARTRIAAFGLDPDICDSEDCTDVATPWGLAKTLNEEAAIFGRNDGWNADGSLSRDYNEIPFSSDFMGDNQYQASNDPWNLDEPSKWQPLTETDHLGFVFYQEHVTPHIGFTGRSVFLTDKEICDRVADAPNYDYEVEMDLAINRLASLTDEEKMLIEYFDSKIGSLVPLSIQYFIRMGIPLDSFEVVTWATWLQVVSYEATQVVWKEKINHDAVRPPSLIQVEKDGETITSYAGRTRDGETRGTQSFDGSNWEPYIRTMPHAEYPSGSACLCEVFAEAMILFTGSDDVTAALGGPLVVTFPAFSSHLEPLSTPANEIMVFFNSWSEISAACGQSRLDGGMHFTASVPAGQELCNGIGTIVIDAFNDLINGERPAYVVDIDNIEGDIPFRQECFAQSSDSDSSSDNDSSDD